MPTRKPNILGITTTALGDTVLNIPAINAIGKQANIDLVVHSRNSELFTNNNWIRSISTYRNNQAFRFFLAMKLRRTYYDSVVILHANSDIIKLLELIRYNTAYCVQPWNIPDLRLYQVFYDPHEHHIDKRMRLAYAVGIKRTVEPMIVDLTEEESNFATSWLKERGVNGPYFCVCPGASLPYRRWPIDRFSEFISKFIGIHPSFEVVIIGSRSETSLFRSIKRSCPTAIPAIGLGLRKLSTLLKGAVMLVTNDTGPMHLGQAVGTNVLAIFGPSDPVTIGPRGAGHRVIASGPTCSPCITKKCKDPVCIEKITVDQVLKATEDMISKDGARQRIRQG